MRHYPHSAAGIAVVIATAVAALAQDGSLRDRMVAVKILAPVDPAEVGLVKLRGQAVRVKGHGPAAETPLIVVSDLDLYLLQSDRELHQELLALLKSWKPRSKAELWGNGDGGPFGLAGDFGGGKAILLRDGPIEPVAPRVREQNLWPWEAYELIARRFAGHGPVRVIHLTRWYDLDARKPDRFYSGDYDETPLETFWPFIGDSGLMVFPVTIPGSRKRTSAPRRIRTFSSGLMGGYEYVAGGAPGIAMREALADAERMTLFELEVPAGKQNWRGRAPKLEFFNKAGRRVFWRYFVASGESADEEAGRREMERRLSRVLEPMAVEKAEVTASCGLLRAADGQSAFLRLEGAAFPPRLKDVTKVLVTVRPHGARRAALTSRGHEATLLRDGNAACIGLLDAGEEGDVLIYDKETRWMVGVVVKKPAITEAAPPRRPQLRSR